MSSYIVTGGAGFIGSHLTERLLVLGNQVVVIDNLSTGSIANLAHLSSYTQSGQLMLHAEDVSTYEGLEAQIHAADGVFHLAAMVGVENILHKTLLSMQNNLQTTERVLKYCARYGKKLLFTSSSEVYGQSEKELFSENDTLHIGSSHLPRWSYASAKIIEEHLVMAHHRELKMPSVIVRLFNTIGERQSDRYGMVVPRFVRQAVRGEALTVYGDGTQQRCFTAVDDVVTAMIKLINCPAANGQIVNIGTQELVSIKQLAARVIEQTTRHSSIRIIPYSDLSAEGFVDMRYRKPDLAKMRKFIDYTPQWTLDQMIERLIQYEKSKQPII